MNLALQHINNVYLLGIGGIGMSALARYFKHTGKNVAGYDLTQTRLTEQLEAEGIPVHYTDDISLIPEAFKPGNTLVVYTPAVPADHSEYNWLKAEGYKIIKRAKVLGLLCDETKTIVVSGTHGKTTVSTMVSVILKHSSLGCGAFLGGISKNFGTNLVLPEPGNQWLVTEGDEYDRSFLNLFPTIALVTSIDADHLDIYGTYDEIVKSFTDFVNQIKPGGTLICKKGVNLKLANSGQVKVLTYALRDEAGYYATNIRLEDEKYVFDLKTPNGLVTDFSLTYPGLVNVENAVAASAICLEAGVPVSELKAGLAAYQGVKRRFDIRFRNEKILFIDDYAHHPKELEAIITSVKNLYPGKKVSGIFQPHLFSRTNDLADGFAQSLSLLDHIYLLPIYPAREKPIEGVTSGLILGKMEGKSVELVEKAGLIEKVLGDEPEILLTVGAGDIDKIADAIASELERRSHV